MSQRNFALESWNRLSKLPMGKQAWSRLVAARTPYFSSIAPVMNELRPGHAEASMKKRRAVTNHIRTVHAIAMCNLAEFVGGLTAEVSTPSTHRWIPKGMTVEYVKKAQTDLSAVCDAPLPAFGNEGFDWTLPVDVRDRVGQTVLRAAITMWITPKK
jgi:acyl-coenzyme A thioesterase PaaI-like protein